jgi:glycosyltransferase involved in cell wall biosynthesis
MKAAIVTQPYDRVLPPSQNSIGLIVYNTAQALSGAVDLALYGRFDRPAGASATFPFDTHDIPVPFDDMLHNAVREYPSWVRRLHAQDLADAHPQYVRRVRRELDRAEPDIVHVMNYWNWSGQLRGRSARRKIVLEMQCEWLSQKDHSAVARQLRSVSAVLGVSDHISTLFRNAFPEYPGVVATVNNGVDVDTFQPAGSRESRLPAGVGPRIVFVGRTSPEKGLHTLLESFVRVSSRIPGACLDIIGPRSTLAEDFIVGISADPLVNALKRFYDGTTGAEYQAYLDKSVSRLGLTGKVRFLGSMPHKDLAAAYNAADLVVNPSLSESFGISIVEAMATGVPVVATRVGGMVETMVQGETGLLVDAEQPEALAAAILTILENRELADRMGANGRARAVSRFSWHARGKRVLEVYRQLAESSARF